ncbi:MAG TPA: hypothetical protein PK322_03970 [Opitutaceae bacterium]|nr:hypothetical protein [Opitutaceae bacterium]
MKTRAAFWALYFAILFVAVFSSGCPRGRARVAIRQGGGLSAIAPPNPETPATVAESSLPIPAGSPVEIRREVPSPLPEGAPPGGTPPPPIVETVRVTPSAATVLTLTRAESGTQRPPDKRAELRAADNAARAPILYVSIACALGAVAFGFLRYPTATIAAGIASALFFFAWQSAGLPAWLIVLAWVLVGGAVALYAGHELGERRKRLAAAASVNQPQPAAPVA